MRRDEQRSQAFCIAEGMIHMRVQVRQALAVAALAFPLYGARHVVAFAAAGQLAAMSYAIVVTLRHLARERI